MSSTTPAKTPLRKSVRRVSPIVITISENRDIHGKFSRVTSPTTPSTTPRRGRTNTTTGDEEILPSTPIATRLSRHRTPSHTTPTKFESSRPGRSLATPARMTTQIPPSPAVWSTSSVRKSDRNSVIKTPTSSRKVRYPKTFNDNASTPSDSSGDEDNARYRKTKKTEPSSVNRRTSMRLTGKSQNYDESLNLFSFSSDNESKAVSPKRGRRSCVVEKTIPATTTPTTSKNSGGGGRMTRSSMKMDKITESSSSSSSSSDDKVEENIISKKTAPKKSNKMLISSPPPPNTPGTVWRFNSVGVPECPLPCREAQFEEIWTFLNENITQRNSRCMYVSGVPGTGKTLIIQSVVDCLYRYATERKEHLLFNNIYINGLSLRTPDKIWKKFYNLLEPTKAKDKCKPTLALKKLNNFFETKGRLPVVLVIDELDQLLDKKQSILYQLLEWTTKPEYMFSLIAIFNTVSLPENALVMRNSSRMGFVRCIFPPYSHDQLQTIVKRSLDRCKSDKIQDEAITLLSRKVAAVSGDARRALEIAARAVEIVEIKKISGILGVNEAFKEIFSSIKIETMKHCSFLEQSVLKHLTQELESSGSDETTLMSLFETLSCNAAYDVGHNWTRNQFMGAVTKLLMMKLVIAENNSPSMHKKVSLNVPFEDVNFALGIKRGDDN
ncbi:origin recognition complex subunit 1 [Folsomia candida]|uniref:origin recognition complex subunit 1 n=1 Tax=Folsomia candida TaxID=158441 RepID=UPI000B8F591B|nr:origin recognition complex subunit 1 [Folsomia candida]